MEKFFYVSQCFHLQNEGNNSIYHTGRHVFNHLFSNNSVKSLLAYAFDFFFNALKMIVANPSEDGQVLRVIPSTQTGMAQVIIPQGQLVDVNSPQGE